MSTVHCVYTRTRLRVIRNPPAEPVGDAGASAGSGLEWVPVPFAIGDMASESSPLSSRSRLRDDGALGVASRSASLSGVRDLSLSTGSS